MILFNWFGVALIPIVMLIGERMRADGAPHADPALLPDRCAGGPPIVFLTANMFWLLAAFRPERAPELTLLLNDLAWITFTCGSRSSIAQCLFLALAIVWDEQAQPVFPRWVAWFNVVIAVALAPAAFAGLAHERPVRLGRLLVVLGQEHRDRAVDRRDGRRARPAMQRDADGAAEVDGVTCETGACSTDPKRELWFAWYVMVVFYSLYSVIFFVLVTHAAAGQALARAPSRPSAWFDDRHWGLLIGFALIFVLGGFVGDGHRADHVLDPADVGEPCRSPTRTSSSTSIAAIPGFLFICIAMTAGAHASRPQPELQQWLYDFGFLSFCGTMGVFLIGSLIWMTAILLDKNRVFPKWFGYLNLCNALTEVVIAPSWIFQRGVFAWNGAIACGSTSRVRHLHRCLHRACSGT